MNRLYKIFSGLSFCFSARPHWKSGIPVFFLILFMLVSVSYCFRENVLQKVEEYNSGVTLYLEVLSVFPANGAVEVETYSVIRAEFNDSINMSTVNSSTFSVNGGSVTGTFSYDPILRSVTFTPGTDLAYSTFYTVTLTKGIKSDSGDSLASEYIWMFTTAAQYFITVVSVSPADGAGDIAVNSDIEAVFNDNIDMLTVDTVEFSVNGGTVGGAFSYDDQLKRVIFNPSSDFSPATLYTVVLSTGIKNIAGESMSSAYSWSFTTAAALAPEINTFSPLSEIFSGDTYDYGSIVNLTTKPVIMTISSDGDADLNITSISLSGADSGDFNMLVNPAPVIVGMGLDTAFTVEFKPLSVGTKNAIVTILSNDIAESPYIINLTGVSLLTALPEIQITQGGVILISPTSTVDFGTLDAGTTGTIELVMHNIGSADLVVTGVIINGTNPDLFSTDFGAVPETITPGSTKTFNISFSSPGKINARANIVFQNNDADESSFTIKLKGRVK